MQKMKTYSESQSSLLNTKVLLLNLISLIFLPVFIFSAEMREINPNLTANIDFNSQYFVNINLGFSKIGFSLNTMEEYGGINTEYNGQKYKTYEYLSREVDNIVKSGNVTTSNFSNQKCNNLACLKGSYSITGISNNSSSFKIQCDIEVYTESGTIVLANNKQINVNKGTTVISHSIDYKFCSSFTNQNYPDSCLNKNTKKPYDFYWLKNTINFRGGVAPLTEADMINYKLRIFDLGNFKLEFIDMDNEIYKNTYDLLNKFSARFDPIILQKNPILMVAVVDPIPASSSKTSNLVLSPNFESNYTYFSPGGRQQIDFKNSNITTFIEAVPIALLGLKNDLWLKSKDYLENLNFATVDGQYAKQNGVYQGNLRYWMRYSNTTFETTPFIEQIYLAGEQSNSGKIFSQNNKAGDVLLVYNITNKYITSYQEMSDIIKFIVGLRFTSSQNSKDVYIKVAVNSFYYEKNHDMYTLKKVVVSRESDDQTFEIDFTSTSNLKNFCYQTFCYISLYINNYSEDSSHNISIFISSANPDLNKSLVSLGNYKVTPFNALIFFFTKSPNGSFNDGFDESARNKGVIIYNEHSTMGVTYIAETNQGKPVSSYREVKDFDSLKFSNYQKNGITEMKASNIFLKGYTYTSMTIKYTEFGETGSIETGKQIDGNIVQFKNFLNMDKINYVNRNFRLDVKLISWPYCFSYDWMCSSKIDNKFRIHLSFWRKTSQDVVLEKFADEFRIIPLTANLVEVNKIFNRENSIDSMIIVFEVPLPNTSSDAELSFFFENPSSPFQNNLTNLIITIVFSVVGFLIIVGLAIFCWIRAKNRIPSALVEGKSSSRSVM